MKEEINALSHKYGREKRFRSMRSSKSKKIDPMTENCTIVVNDGVFVV